MNIQKLATEILAADVSELEPKVQNRVKELKKIHQQIKEIEDRVKEQVGDLQKQIKTLEKQSSIFEKEIMPELKRLEDHAIRAEGILIELKPGKRSPKVGYEFLASKVSSELIAAAEEAITKAAEFAQNPTIEIPDAVKASKKKTAGRILEWFAEKFRMLLGWAESLTVRNDKIGTMLDELEGVGGYDVRR